MVVPEISKCFTNFQAKHMLQSLNQGKLSP